MDKVRRQEHRALMKEGLEDLKGTKYDWLTHPANMSAKQKARFQQLRTSTLKTARAWAIKEIAVVALVHREGLGAMVVVGHAVSAGTAQNTPVGYPQCDHPAPCGSTAEVRSRGFRNKRRFAHGGLDLYPAASAGEFTH